MILWILSGGRERARGPADHRTSYVVLFETVRQIDDDVPATYSSIRYRTSIYMMSIRRNVVPPPHTRTAPHTHIKHSKKAAGEGGARGQAAYTSYCTGVLYRYHTAASSTTVPVLYCYAVQQYGTKKRHSTHCFCCCYSTYRWLCCCVKSAVYNKIAILYR